MASVASMALKRPEDSFLLSCESFFRRCCLYNQNQGIRQEGALSRLGPSLAPLLRNSYEPSGALRGLDLTAARWPSVYLSLFSVVNNLDVDDLCCEHHLYNGKA